MGEQVLETPDVKEDDKVEGDNENPHGNQFERRPSGPRNRGRSGGNRFNQRGRMPPRRGGGGPWSRHQDDNPDMEHNDSRDNRLHDKLSHISGPTIDLPPVELGDKKFMGKNRLYIGNLGPDVTEEDLNEVLGKFGDFAELFLNRDKYFAFVKFDYYSNAEKAKSEMDGMLIKNKNLKVRFAPNTAAIKVKNLPNFVSNELLYHAFQVFGDIERALVCVDERGKPTGEGVIEFSRKGSALSAIRKCNERCFYITEALRPCIVEGYEAVNDNDGVPEKFFPKRHPEYLKARSKGPRMADVNSFEHEYGVRWKQLLELHDKKLEALKQELQIEKEKLEAQMEYTRYEHETQLLREELRLREMGRERQKQEWELKERQVEEQRRRTEENLRRQEESLQTRMIDDDMRRRQQENNLFMQARQLSNILEEQEQKFTVDDGFKRREDFEPPEGANDGNSRSSGGFGRDRWVTDHRDDFPSKRRRFDF